MTEKRNIRGVAAIGGLSAAIALLTGLPAVSADELADLRAKQQLLQTNQELLQKRIDQLSQAPPPGAPGPYVPGFGPETRPTNGTGHHRQLPAIVSDPRHRHLAAHRRHRLDRRYLVAPGCRAGRSAQQPRRQSQSDLSGRVGRHRQFGQHPAQQHDRARAQPSVRHHFAAEIRGCSSTPARRPPGARSRPISKWISASTTRMSSTATIRAVTNSCDNPVPQGLRDDRRAGGRPGYRDPARSRRRPRTGRLRRHGDERRPGARRRRSNTPIRVPTAPCLRSGSRTRCRGCRPRSAKSDIDTEQIPNIAACSVTGNTTANLPATTACLGPNARFSAPLQAVMPEWIATARINNPWGHLQIGGVLRNDQLNDGQYLNQSLCRLWRHDQRRRPPVLAVPRVRWARTISALARATATASATRCANGSGLVTNFGAPINVPGFGLVNPLTNTQLEPKHQRPDPGQRDQRQAGL